MQNLLDQLEALPDWQKYGAVGVLCIIIVFGYYYFSWAPNAEEIEKLNNDIVKLDAQIKTGMAMKDRERELEREVALLDEQLKVALDILPDQEAMDQFIKTIENLAVDSGLVVDRFIPRPPRVEDFKGIIPVDLGIRGSYHSVGLFFEKLANEPRIVNVGGFNLKGTQGKRNYTLEGEIKVLAFFFIKK